MNKVMGLVSDIYVDFILDIFIYCLKIKTCYNNEFLYSLFLEELFLGNPALIDYVYMGVMQNIMSFSDIIGLIGAFLVLLAYILIYVHKISTDGLSYCLLNLLGGVMILFSLIYEWNTPAVIIEVAWIAISLYGLSNWLRVKYRL